MTSLIVKLKLSRAALATLESPRPPVPPAQQHRYNTRLAARAAKLAEHNTRGKTPKLAPAFVAKEKPLPDVQPLPETSMPVSLVSPLDLALPVAEIMTILQGTKSAAALTSKKRKRKKDVACSGGNEEPVQPCKVARV
ncbi:hypothetical protein EDC01DRAFT_632956 [Geopyxis carbonaria]|nr:hypothetical protein EDC01DRAFT_632956 [Geopyxis carbonaria]